MSPCHHNSIKWYDEWEAVLSLMVLGQQFKHRQGSYNILGEFKITTECIHGTWEGATAAKFKAKNIVCVETIYDKG